MSVRIWHNHFQVSGLVAGHAWGSHGSRIDATAGGSDSEPRARVHRPRTRGRGWGEKPESGKTTPEAVSETTSIRADEGTYHNCYVPHILLSIMVVCALPGGADKNCTSYAGLLIGSNDAR
jgi:hypothetical protein